MTDTTITINTQDGYQYILADREAPSENWQDSVTGNKDGTPSLAWKRAKTTTFMSASWRQIMCPIPSCKRWRFKSWLAAAIYLFLRRLLRRSSPRLRWTGQYGMALFALLWHAGINAYDLIRNPAAETTIFVTAMLGLAVFIQMPVAHSLAAYGLSYSLFMGLAGGLLSSGKLINLTFTAIVAMAVSMTSFRHAVVTACQRREIGQMNRRLQEMVQKDPLTGLMNTAAFRHRVRSYLTSAEADAEIFLLILDLDDFKRINDAFGHPCGDDVLQAVAIKLQALFPNTIGAARIGGDEFMLALADISPQEVERSFDRFLLDMEQLRWHGQTLSVSCSMGACRASRPGITFDELYDAADRALYQAKRLGKGRLICCEPVPSS